MYSSCFRTCDCEICAFLEMHKAYNYLFICISFPDENTGNGVSLSERTMLPGNAEVSSDASVGVWKYLIS